MATPWWDTSPYFRWEPLVLPRKHSRLDIEITHIIPECKRCLRSLTDVRAQFYEFNRCLEVRCAGVCHHCRLILYSRFRWYPDGRVLVEREDGWETYIAQYVRPGDALWAWLTRKWRQLLS